MQKRLLNIFLAAFVLLGMWTCDGQAQGRPLMRELSLNDKDRILVLAPHPDDEVLGVGGVIQHALRRNIPVKVVFLTYGDSNPWSFLLYRKHPVIMPGAVKSMGLVRKDEAVSAAGILGLEADKLIFLGYPDFGTLNIWYRHWNDRPPYRSVLTRVQQVPYQGAFRPQAPYKGESIISDLRSIIRDFKPTAIFISHPADHNGDHLALYLYTRVALWDEGLTDKIALYPYLIHYLGWPKPMGLKPNQDILPPKSLIQFNQWSEYRLSQEEFERKKEALQAHKSQFTSSPRYLLSFIRYNEIFGDFPSVKLHLNEESSIFVARKERFSAADLPDEFNAVEKNAFVGVEWKLIRWEGDDLIVSIEMTKPLARDVEAFIYIFGYSKKTPFGQMPKISLRLGSEGYSLYDQSKRIKDESIRVKRTSNEVTLAVPFELLGYPDRILTSARTYLGNVPLDGASWIAVELE